MHAEVLIAHPHHEDIPETQPDLVLCELGDPGDGILESFSPFCVKVHRALRVSGLHYKRRHGRMPGDFRNLNPLGQVPVLLIDDRPLSDSTEILKAIEALTGQPPWRSAAWAAEARLYEELGDTVLNPYVIAARWADEASWPAVRTAFFEEMPAVLRSVIPGRVRAGVLRRLAAMRVLEGGMSACRDRFTDLLDQLDARAPRAGFWLGAEITAADLGLFAQLKSLQHPITPHWKALIEARPRLQGWINRVDIATAG